MYDLRVYISNATTRREEEKSKSLLLLLPFSIIIIIFELFCTVKSSGARQ
jgi:hypothetical protein